MSRIALSGNPLGTGTFTIASPNSNTDRTVNLPDAGGDMVLTDATQTLTNKSIVATQLTGTVPAARLGSGTADSTTFLRGDNTWQTISTTPTTAQVLTATAGASVGAVGTYTVAYAPSITLNPGSTVAGSSLRGLTSGSSWGYNPGFTGTWRHMGVSQQSSDSGNEGRWACFLRIS